MSAACVLSAKVGQDRRFKAPVSGCVSIVASQINLYGGPCGDCYLDLQDLNFAGKVGDHCGPRSPVTLVAQSLALSMGGLGAPVLKVKVPAQRRIWRMTFRRLVGVKMSSG